MHQLPSHYWCGMQNLQTLPNKTAHQGKAGKEIAAFSGEKGHVGQKYKKKQNNITCP